MDRHPSMISRIFASILLAFLVLAISIPAFSQSVSQGSKQEGDTTGVEKDNPFERLNAQEREYGKITSAYRDKVLKEAQKNNQRLGRDTSGVAAGTPGQPTSGPAWVNIGPTGQQFAQNGSFTGEIVDSGRLRTILTHPTNGNIVYILSSAGGMWKTTNFEDAVPNWTPLTDFLPTTAGGAAAFGKTPNTIYLGLGDPYDQITVGGAIVKSTDGGNTWSPMITLGNTISVRDVKVDTSGTYDVVLVGTDGGLWRSTDSGATYSQVTGFAFQNQYIWSLAQTSAGWVMATQETQPITNGNCVVGTRWCTGAGHIYLSTDKGATWVEQTSGLSNFGRTTLGVGTPGDPVIYAFSALPANGTSASIVQRDLFRSDDGGKTWVALGVNSTKAPLNPNPYQTNMDIMRGQAWYNQTIGVDPSDPTHNTVYLGGTYSAAKTTDGGASWTVLSQWLYDYTPGIPYVHADMHAMAFKTAGTPMVLLGTDGGIFASADNGATWDSNKNNNLVTHMFYSIIGNQFFPNFAMGGLQDNGTRVRLDDTGIFNQSNGGDGFGVGFSQANSETALQSVYYLSMRRSRTQLPPRNYTEMQSSLGSRSDGGFYTPIYSPAPGADPSGMYFFSYGAAGSTGGIYFTNNGGITWYILNRVGTAGSGLPSGTGFRDNPFGFGISPTNLNHMAIGANGGRCFVSLDGGATWATTLTTDSIPGWQGFVGNVTWGDDNTIWVTSTTQTEGLYNGVPTVRVVKSTDQGATWAAAGNGLPDVPVTKIQIDPRDETGNTAYAATHVGVYATTDGGASWSPYGAGLPNVRVNDIYMPPDGGYLRIATYGRGIWQLSDLDYVGAAMVDDGISCDNNGTVGNNETGHLTLTFHNPRGVDVAGGNVTVTSDNPHLIFTAGNQTTIGTVGANGNASASLAIKVQGATGIETANLTITFGNAATATIHEPINLNYDDNANGSGTAVSFDSQVSGWTVTATAAPKLGDVFAWERRELSPIHHTMAVIDSNGVQDTSLVSPVLKVGASNFSFSFNHRFNFENTWDGGAIEISTDNGATWTQLTTEITAGGYNGTINAAATNPHAGKMAWTNISTGWPAYTTVTVDLGTTYANKDVLIRFRSAADDNTGRQGWEISDMSFTGLTNTPFGAVVTHNEACKSTAALVSAANPSNYPDSVTFTATISGGITPATGTVNFKEGAVVLGSAAAVDNVATFSISTLAVGSHYVVASFAGDAGHAAADSPAYKHTVLAVPRSLMTPNTLDFGDVHTGSTSPVMTSVLKNSGTAPLIIAGFAVTGDYTATNNCSTSLAANASCTISVTFAPAAVQGVRTGAVTMSANGISGDTVLHLTGNAVGAAISMDHSSVSYANTLVGTSTAAQSVTITNSGNIDLNVASVGITGDFAETNDCTAGPIIPGAHCTVNVTFTPTATGTRNGTVTLTSDAAGSPQSFSVSGKGEYLQISGTTTQTVSVKSAATYPLTLHASSAFAGAVSLTCTGAPARTNCVIDNASPSLTTGTASVTVSVNPAPTTTTSSLGVGQMFFASFGLFGVLLLPFSRKVRKSHKALSMLVLALVLTISLGGMVACGGDSKTPPPPTPTTTYATPGTYTLTVTATSGGTTLQTQTLTLTLQ